MLELAQVEASAASLFLTRLQGQMNVKQAQGRNLQNLLNSESQICNFFLT